MKLEARGTLLRHDTMKLGSAGIVVLPLETQQLPVSMSSIARASLAGLGLLSALPNWRSLKPCFEHVQRKALAGCCSCPTLARALFQTAKDMSPCF